MNTPNADDSVKKDTPVAPHEDRQDNRGELSDTALDAVAGGRIINTVTTRPAGTGGTDAGTAGAGSTTGSTGGFTVDVCMTPAAPYPIPIPYPNLKI